MTKPAIAAVLENYGWDGRLSGRGPWYRVNCVFHGDRHASASLNQDEQVFTCHGCEIKGDAYAIVMQKEGVDFATAKQRVESITGHSGQPVSEHTGLSPARLAGSKLPAWTRDRRGSNRRLSSRNGRRNHS